MTGSWKNGSVRLVVQPLSVHWLEPTMCAAAAGSPWRATATGADAVWPANAEVAIVVPCDVVRANWSAFSRTTSRLPLVPAIVIAAAGTVAPPGLVIVTFSGAIPVSSVPLLTSISVRPLNCAPLNVSACAAAGASSSSAAPASSVVPRNLILAALLHIDPALGSYARGPR